MALACFYGNEYEKVSRFSLDHRFFTEAKTTVVLVHDLATIFTADLLHLDELAASLFMLLLRCYSLVQPRACAEEFVQVLTTRDC